MKALSDHISLLISWKFPQHNYATRLDTNMDQLKSLIGILVELNFINDWFEIKHEYLQLPMDPSGCFEGTMCYSVRTFFTAMHTCIRLQYGSCPKVSHTLICLITWFLQTAIGELPNLKSFKVWDHCRFCRDHPPL